MFTQHGKPLRKHWSIHVRMYRNDADRKVMKRLRMTDEEKALRRAAKLDYKEFPTEAECEAFRKTLPQALQDITQSLEGAWL